MATSKEDIRRWLEYALKEGSQFMIVVCDDFDYKDYPINCKDAKECKAEYTNHDGINMQRIMQVYDLSIPIDEQLKEKRAFHLPK